MGPQPGSGAAELEVEETLPGRQGSADGPVVVKLDNVRKRVTKLPEQRRTDLDQLGMRW
ncbi:hypothetical protein ACWCXX_39810 [Streptomyces sp. NPDC001732]